MPVFSGSTPDADNADEGKLQNPPHERPLFAGFFICGEVMEIVINGKSDAGDFSTVEELLRARSLEPATLVVELNGKIIPREDYASVHLKDGDTVEIVQFVAGG